MNDLVNGEWSIILIPNLKRKSEAGIIYIHH